MALEYNRGAYFPAVLSLIKLHFRSFWYIIGGGTQPNLILWGDDTESEGWWAKIWKSDPELATEAKVEVGDEDPIKRARDIRDAAIGIAEDEDPGEDYFDGMTRRRGDNGDLEELEDDWELIVLALLAMGIGALILLRRVYEQRRRLAWEREQRERRQRMQQAGHQGQQDEPVDPVNQPPPPPAPVARLEAPLPPIDMFL
jgi:SEL1 protein